MLQISSVQEGGCKHHNSKADDDHRGVLEDCQSLSDHKLARDHSSVDTHRPASLFQTALRKRTFMQQWPKPDRRRHHSLEQFFWICRRKKGQNVLLLSKRKHAIIPVGNLKMGLPMKEKP